MTVDRMKLEVDGVEDTVFEKPRREMPAEVAVQQCFCDATCWLDFCKSGCAYWCMTQCGGNPTLNNTMYSGNSGTQRQEERAWLHDDITAS